MMRSNFDRLSQIAAIAKAYDAPLRLNVYQAVRTDSFALTYDEYSTGFQRLFEETDMLAIGEPLVRAMAELPSRQGGCGVATVRVTPRATVQPCVYWPGPGAPLHPVRVRRRNPAFGKLRSGPFIANILQVLRLPRLLPRRLRGKAKASRPAR